MFTLLVADDESIECRAMEMLIQNNISDVITLPYVENGTDFIRKMEMLKPDIAIVDINMPGLTGLEAVEIIRMKKIKSKIIIHTAYSDFEYIQKALSLGAVEYILKPEKKEKVVEVIRRVCNILKQERQEEINQTKIGSIYKDFDIIMENEIMMSVLLGELALNSFQKYCEMKELEYSFGVLIAVELIDSNSILFSEEQYDAAITHIKNELETICTLLCKYAGGRIYILALAPSSIRENQILPWFKDTVEIGLKSLETSGSTRFRVGFSRFYKEFCDMVKAYKESAIALDCCEPFRFKFYSSEDKKHESVLLFSFYFEDICYAMERGDCGKLKNILDRIWEKQSETEQDIGDLKSQTVDAMLSIQSEYWGRKENEMFVFSNYKELTDSIVLLHSGPEIRDWMYDKLCRAMEEAASKENRNEYVVRAVKILQTDYMKDISLENVADEIKISPFYLSRLIKQQLNKTFLEYLTDIRISHGIRLLRQRTLSIKEIGSKIGYTNQTYFYKVFKKQTGITIGEMREEMRKNGGKYYGKGRN